MMGVTSNLYESKEYSDIREVIKDGINRYPDCVAFTIKNPTKDQLFLTEYLQNKLHSFNELIYFPKNQGFYRILKQKQVVFDTTFQKWEGNNENKRSYHTDAPCCFRRLYIFGISRFRF